MTSVAGQSGVSADQGEPVLVLLDVLDGNLPSLDRMAVLAVGSELSAVDIGVAVSARVANVRKQQFGVAVSARAHGRVHATQRIPGLAVIKIRHRTNWFPTRTGVAGLARKRERTVGTSGRGLVRPLLAGRQERHRQSKQNQHRPSHCFVCPHSFWRTEPVKWPYRVLCFKSTLTTVSLRDMIRDSHISPSTTMPSLGESTLLHQNPEFLALMDNALSWDDCRSPTLPP